MDKTKLIEEYIMNAIRLGLTKDIGPNWKGEVGECVFERDSGKFGIIHDSDGKEYTVYHPPVVYDGSTEVTTYHNTLHFVVFKDDVQRPPITW